MMDGRVFIFSFVYISVLVKTDVAPYTPVLDTDTIYDRDFNFHSKDKFLKDHIKKLINCIETAPGIPPPPQMNLLPEVSLLKSNKQSPSGTERFIFEYIGAREYRETCLGDSYKRDFIRRLYDASCMNYEEKIKFLNLLSCDASQNLECRQVGVEPNRQFAEQATPIMRCLCPDFNKSQAYLSDTSRGYFDSKRKQCVLKTGQKCTIQPKALDARLEWNDFDYPPNGIDVVDLRPLSRTYPCVNNAFCYTDDVQGLEISKINRDSCVCMAGYFSGADRECHQGRDPPTVKGLLLAVVMYFIGVLTFVAVLLI